ncbi:MAG: hypothetical protein ABR508_05890 [Candidatus Baltobacteraceae bacterium]
MLFLWFYHACRRGAPRFLMVSDHINYLTFEDPGAVHTVRRALKLAEAGDLYGAAETAGVDVAHAAVVSQGLRRGMRFSIGAELDNDPRARPDAQNIVDAMRPDGMIRAVHFLTIEHPEKGADYQWAFDNPEFRELYDVVGTERVWDLYVAKLIEDIEKLPGHIVAHFYVPAQFGHWPDPQKLEEYEDRLLDACALRGMAVEFNTRFLYRENDPQEKDRYRAAIARLMKKAKAKDVGIAIASDAHSPKDQGNGFNEILKLLDEAKVNEVVFPVGGRLARVALRATKEHLQKVKAQEPAPQAGSSISGFSRAELGLPERDEAQERVLAAAAAASKKAKAKAAKAAPKVKVPKVKAEPKAKAPPKSKPEPKPKLEPKPKPEPKIKAQAKPKPEPKQPDVKAKPQPKVKAEAKAKAAVKAVVKLVPKAAAKAVPKAKTAAKAVKAAASKLVKPAAKALKPSAKKAAPLKKIVPAALKKAPKKAAAPKKPAAIKKSAPAKTAKKIAPAKKSGTQKKTAAPLKKGARSVSTPKRTVTKKTTKRR